MWWIFLFVQLLDQSYEYSAIQIGILCIDMLDAIMILFIESHWFAKGLAILAQKIDSMNPIQLRDGMDGWFFKQMSKNSYQLYSKDDLKKVLTDEFNLIDYGSVVYEWMQLSRLDINPSNKLMKTRRHLELLHARLPGNVPLPLRHPAECGSHPPGRQTHFLLAPYQGCHLWWFDGAPAQFRSGPLRLRRPRNRYSAEIPEELRGARGSNRYWSVSSIWCYHRKAK